MPRLESGRDESAYGFLATRRANVQSKLPRAAGKRDSQRLGNEIFDLSRWRWQHRDEGRMTEWTGIILYLDFSSIMLRVSWQRFPFPHFLFHHVCQSHSAIVIHRLSSIDPHSQHTLQISHRHPVTHIRHDEPGSCVGACQTGRRVEQRESRCSGSVTVDQGDQVWVSAHRPSVLWSRHPSNHLASSSLSPVHPQARSDPYQSTSA